jgi:2,4-dienoyl-CoA reductase-like NADH-dependent reductase (Old Yellow Enzyme family)
MVLRMDTIDPLLTDVEAFLESEGMTATAFGVKSLNDPTFVHELRRGRDCRRSTRIKVGVFIRSQSSESA